METQQKTKGIWFTADTHFGHKNVIRFCDRPFGSIKEHDETIIENWNAVVKPSDTIFHLGDFAFAGKDYVQEILESLNGQKFFIRGNHDKVMKGPLLDYFVWNGHYYELKVQDEDFDGRHVLVLCHYAFEVWNKRHYGSWHLHAHSHGSLPTPEYMRRLDVGVDCHDFFPISYEIVKEKMALKSFKPIDHHEGGSSTTEP